MSRYPEFKPDHIADYPLESRSSKVSVDHFARMVVEGTLSSFLDSLPAQFAAQDLRQLVAALKAARHSGRAMIWGFGGHVIKLGLGPILIDLMERGFVSALATNGSGVIHDFEIALCGHTSEDVDQELKTGAFGMARETGEYLNRAITEGAGADQGIGEAVGEFLSRADMRHGDLSVLLQAFERNLPCTVHMAFGTDIIHNHPSASGEAMGKGTQIDFRIFTHQVSGLDGGGVYLNLGSAVILPEVFLKAVSLVRNSGRSLEGFTTANLDFIQHYRPARNVVERPVASSGRGISLTGHHEIMVPLLAALLVHT